MGTAMDVNGLRVDSANSWLNPTNVPAHDTGAIVSLCSHFVNRETNIVQGIQELRCQRICPCAIFCMDES